MRLPRETGGCRTWCVVSRIEEDGKPLPEGITGQPRFRRLFALKKLFIFRSSGIDTFTTSRLEGRRDITKDLYLIGTISQWRSAWRLQDPLSIPLQLADRGKYPGRRRQRGTKHASHLFTNEVRGTPNGASLSLTRLEDLISKP